MFSLMFMMLFSLLPFPMLAVVLATERLTKRAQEAAR
jgi:ABC-type spermidine/putrescine transport system permease subunit I